MALDEIGRRYADGFYQRRLHELPNEEQEIGALRNQHASRGSLRSGNYVHELCQLLLRRVDTLAQSKAEGLVRAYEKSGLAFDENAYHESKREIVEFCHSQQHSLIGSLTPMVRQTLGADVPAGTFDSLSKGIISGIDSIIGRLVCDLEIKRDETILEDRKTKRAYAAGLGKEWDAFICHASEDKSDFVDPFARRLRDSGLSVWYDVFSLKVGDSLRRKIDEGLTKSRYGIVVLSKLFFSKEWPQNELDGLMGKEVAGTKVILPIWHNITADEVRAKSPILAGRVAAKSEHGLEKVISEIREAMGISYVETAANASAKQPLNLRLEFRGEHPEGPSLWVTSSRNIIATQLDYLDDRDVRVASERLETGGQDFDIPIRHHELVKISSMKPRTGYETIPVAFRLHILDGDHPFKQTIPAALQPSIKPVNGIPTAFFKLLG
jgi:hypothetical protein